jgi:hypothetical protein
MWKSEFISNNTNLILKQNSNWFYKFKIHIFWKSGCIMVRLSMSTGRLISVTFI